MIDRSKGTKTKMIGMLLPESLQPMPSIFHTLIFLAILLQLFSWANHHLTKKNRERFPSPWKLPVIGNLHQLGGHAHRSLKALSDIHGPLMLIQIGSYPCLVASTASAAEEILKTHDKAFASRKAVYVGEKLFYNRRDIAFAPYGDFWRKAKGLGTVHVLSTAKVRSARAVREDEVAAMLEKIDAVPGHSKLVNLTELARETINSFSSRITLGKKYHAGDSGGVREVLVELMELIGFTNLGDFIPWLSWVNKFNGFETRVDKCRRSLDLLLERVLEDHARGKIEGGSFVDVLLNLEQQNSFSTGGFSLGRDGLKALVLDMFSGGSHTGFTVVDWTMTELMRHPKVMAKAQAEVRTSVASGAVGSQCKAMVGEDDIQKMSYLKRVIKEVLRLHPPFPLLVPRESISDVHIQGKYFIPKGTMAIVNCWAVARDPEWWDKPDEFLPERFESVDDPPDFRGLDMQLIPFGGGRRICPGISFALAIIECVVANLLYRFDFELPEGVASEDLDITESTGFADSRKSNLVVVARPRHA